MTENASNEWAMEPRVRVRARVVREALRITTDPLRSGLHDAERRFLSAQRDATHGAPGALSEYLTIMTDLGIIDERLEEVADRRDVSYLTNRRLSHLREHCRWLARRVSADFLLALQVRLEQELKEIIGPEAYQMFLRFEDVEDVAGEIDRLSDDDLMVRLREGTLLRGILEQVRLGDILGRTGQKGTTIPVSDMD